MPDPALAVEVLDSLQRYAFAYVDRISSEVAAEYVAELDRIQTRARAARTDVVRALIAGGRVDLRHAERTLSHRLTGWQTAFVCWTDRDDVDLLRLGAVVGAQLGPTSSAPRSRRRPRTLGVGLHAGHPRVVTESDLGALAEQVPEAVWVTVGTPAQGAAGFRDSHDRAQRGRRIVDLGWAPGPGDVVRRDRPRRHDER